VIIYATIRSKGRTEPNKKVVASITNLDLLVKEAKRLNDYCWPDRKRRHGQKHGNEFL
jgi:hypothetical protein